MRTICPELLAAKIQRLRNLEEPELAARLEQQPRTVHALWFLQEMSHQPGGLDKLAGTLSESFPEQFATKAMLAAGPAKNGTWTLEQCLAVWQETASRPIWRADESRWGGNFREWAQLAIGEHDTAKSLRATRTGDAFALVERGLKDFNHSFFALRCTNAAISDLPALLAEYCTPENPLRAPWYCPELFTVLLAHMDQRAASVESTIAPTKVKQIVFRELAFSMSECVPVQIVGNSRFGKTKSVSTLCAMHPGRARLVPVPPENRKKDFLLAHAAALHYTPPRTISACELDRVIQFIVRHSGLFLIYDESQWLIPSSYTRDTPPMRLDWIRSHVIDSPGAAGCAFFATKQSYRQDLDKFVKKTGFVMEQWLGRMAPIVTLPADVDRDDLLAVARLNFPDIRPAFLKLIAARAMQSEGLLHHIEITAKRARFIAREAGRPEPGQADIESAIADMMPHALRPALPSPRASAAAPLPPRGTAPAPPQRDTRPEEETPLAHNRLSAPKSPALAGD